MKILFINDIFNSDEDLQILKKKYSNDEIHDLCIPFLEPKKAIDLIQKEANSYDLLIAEGLGCFLSLGIKSISKIMINFLYPTNVEKAYANNYDAFKELEEIDEEIFLLLNRRRPNTEAYYSQENTYYIFAEENEIENNIGIIDALIESEKAGDMLLIDGRSPFSGNSIYLDSQDVISKGYRNYGHVYEILKAKHSLDVTADSYLNAIDDCISKLKEYINKN